MSSTFDSFTDVGLFKLCIFSRVSLGNLYLSRNFLT